MDYTKKDTNFELIKKAIKEQSEFVFTEFEKKVEEANDSAIDVLYLGLDCLEAQIQAIEQILNNQ